MENQIVEKNATDAMKIVKGPNEDSERATPAMETNRIGAENGPARSNMVVEDAKVAPVGNLPDPGRSPGPATPVVDPTIVPVAAPPAVPSADPVA
jgi:hypothetical protein